MTIEELRHVRFREIAKRAPPAAAAATSGGEGEVASYGKREIEGERKARYIYTYIYTERERGGDSEFILFFSALLRATFTLSIL